MLKRKLTERLRRIEALFVGAKTDGERQAAGEALKRVRARLATVAAEEPTIEHTFRLDNRWSCRLLCALLRHHGLAPFRYRRQRHTTVVVRAPRRLLHESLMPTFENLDRVFRSLATEEATCLVAEVRRTASAARPR